VVINAPNSRHSDDRKIHIASFVLGRPVVVWCPAAGGFAAGVFDKEVSATAYPSATEGSSAHP
jgi:hypothetical protein